MLGWGAACGGESAEPALGSGAGNNEGNAAGASGGERATAGGGSGGSGASPSALRVPLKHRATAQVCDRERPPGNARPYDEQRLVVACTTASDCPVPVPCNGCRTDCIDYGSGPRCVTGAQQCLSDADCAAGDNGRCNNNREIWSCSYDTCYSDATCTTGGPCACEGARSSDANACLPGNCQADADCASDGYCSPTFGDCGNYGGVIAYYCHTPADECVDDAECEGGGGYCMYRPEIGHWACGTGQCVG